MDIGVRAAQLISEVTPHIFLTAAQVTLQQSNSNRTTATSTPSQVKSEICEPFDITGSAMSAAAAAIEKDPTPESSEDENNDEAGADGEEFEVEQILETKMMGRKRHFKVRWKNYGPEWDTWEPEDSLKEGAEESMKEFMIKYEAAKKTKNASKSRKRASATPASASSKANRSRRSTVEDADDESLPDTVSSSDGEGFTPSSAKKKKATNGKSTTPTRNRPARTTTITTPLFSSSKASNDRSPAAAPASGAPFNTSSNGILSNKTPWFMDSSSEDEGKEKQNDTTNSKPSTPTKEQQQKDTPSSSSSLKLVIKSHKTASQNDGEEDGEGETDKDEGIDGGSSSSKKHKKDKHKKKNKKPKIELIFEGIYRKGHGEPLTFVAQHSGSDQTTTYSLEEAIEADSKSLARFLADKVTFVADGVSSVNVINAPSSAATATFSSIGSRV